ncbi:D-alanine--D-alanine ligase [Klebsiella michiganensis]|nr:D-alanine--D-alanine ligase [Klebsiella michiganensis]
MEAIDKTRFDVVLLGIDKQGQWHINDASNYLLNPQDPAHIALRPSDITLAQIPGREAQQLINADTASRWRPSTSFSRLFTAPLGKMVLCRVCCGWLTCPSSAPRPRLRRLHGQRRDQASAARCRAVDCAFITLTRANRHQVSFAEVQAKLGLPLFVKPANQGSSVGVSKVNSEEQ